MKDFDILFIDDTKKVSDSIFEDLSFENIKNAIFTEPEEDILYKNFLSVLKCPLNDIEKIKERQLILKDCLRYSSLPYELYNICMMRKQHTKIERVSVYQSIQNVNGAEKLGGNWQYAENFFEIAEKLNHLLSARPFYSESFNSMKEYFAQTKIFQSLKKQIEEANSILDTGYSSMNITFTGNLNTQYAEIVSVTRPEKQKSQVQNISALLGKIIKKGDKKEEKNPDYTYYDAPFNPIQSLAEEIHARNILFITQTITTISSAMKILFERIAKQILFYQAAVKIIKFYEKHCVDSAFPEFDKHTQKNGLIADKLYDISFFFYLVHIADTEKASEDIDASVEVETKAESEQTAPTINITDNKFTTEESNIFFVTGPNQGGKTTFLRSIGIAQLFAQSGLPVPAKKYECGAFSSILTHFPKLEDDNLDYGKLAEELTRIKEDFPLTKAGGLVLWNESFATTTAKEGIEIASDVITAMAKTDSVIIFVTHLYELALDAENLAAKLPCNQKTSKAHKIINLIAKYKDSADASRQAEGTYKIVPGTPQKQVFAIDLVKK